MTVEISGQAERDFETLPLRVQERVLTLFERLEDWPKVSGVKWLTADWRNHARIRTGDYRVVFHLKGKTVIIDRIAHRRDVYAE